MDVSVKRVMVPLILASCWLVLGASSCQSTTKVNKKDMGKDVLAKKDAGTSNASKNNKDNSKKDDKPPEDGSIKPRDIGPKAPAVFMMSGLKGYTEPCGCTADILLGGIDRIVGYVKAAESMYPSTLMVDAGDLLFDEAELDDHRKPQEKMKASLLMEAHKKMGTKFTVPGVNDFALGTTFYREMLQKGGITPLGINVTIDGKPLDGAKVVELGDFRLGVVGAVSPEAYEGKEVPGVSIAPLKDTLGKGLKKLESDKIDAVLLLFYGTLGDAKGVLEKYKSVDFVQIGKKPRETDQVSSFGRGHTFEVFDQGRYLGVLKLYKKGARDRSKALENARPISKSKIEAIDKRIKYLEDRIRKLKPTSPMQANFRKQIKGLEAEKEKIKNASVKIPTSLGSFLYRAIPMEPGLPVDSDVKVKREKYNKELKRIAQGLDVEVPPVKDGDAFYVGTNQCKTCHMPAYKFWEKTNHAHAMATLRDRDKDFDQSCIGCHVVGYEKPGGSVLGKLEYKFTHQEQEKTKDLRNVGCESCHGPGSKHITLPVGNDGKPQHISRDVTSETCAGSCHVPEHSPKFNFETYVELITGEGHGGGAKK